MNIWTIKEGEPLPLSECVGRQMRCGIITDMLSERGHNVIWWTSDFFHQTKKRLSITGEYQKDDRTKLILLHSPVIYKKTVSVSRFLYSYCLGQKFRKMSRQQEPPDVIYCSFPLIDLAYEAIQYAEERKIPIIVDVRDLWPDIIYDKFSGKTKTAAKYLLSFMEQKTRKVFLEATRLTATVPFDLKWAQNKVKRPNSDADKVFFMGYENKPLNPNEIEEVKRKIKENKIYENDFIICYFGNLTNTIVDIETIIGAASHFQNRSQNVKFVICGTGVSSEEFTEKAKQYSNIIFTGYVNPAFITYLMGISKLGIIPYHDRWDFTDAIPNKAVEYLAGGLPVLSQLSGAFGRLVQEHQCGCVYRDVASLVNGIEKFLGDVEALNKSREHAKALYEEKFEKGKVYSEFCEYIEQTANDK